MQIVVGRPGRTASQGSGTPRSEDSCRQHIPAELLASYPTIPLEEPTVANAPTLTSFAPAQLIPTPRDEFETTAAYGKRIQDFLPGPVLRDSVKLVMLKYDADTETAWLSPAG